MEALLIFITTLAVVSSMYIPNTTFVIPTEILELIFGSTPPPPNQTKLELNLNIKFNDCDKNGGSINKTTGDGTKNVKQNPENCDPDIHSRFVENLNSTDDRVAIEGDNCPSGKVRIGKRCEIPDDGR